VDRRRQQLPHHRGEIAEQETRPRGHLLLVARRARFHHVVARVGERVGHAARIGPFTFIICTASR